MHCVRNLMSVEKIQYSVSHHRVDEVVSKNYNIMWYRKTDSLTRIKACFYISNDIKQIFFREREKDGKRERVREREKMKKLIRISSQSGIDYGVILTVFIKINPMGSVVYRDLYFAIFLCFSSLSLFLFLGLRILLI